MADFGEIFFYIVLGIVVLAAIMIILCVLSPRFRGIICPCSENRYIDRIVEDTVDRDTSDDRTSIELDTIEDGV